MIQNLINYIKAEDKLILFVYIFIFLTPWYFYNSQFSIFTILLFIFWLYKFRFRIIFEKILTLKNSYPFLILFIFFIYTYLTLIWTKNIEHGLWVQKAFRESLLLMPILLLLLEYKHVKKVFNLLIFSICIYAIYSIGIYLGMYTVLDSSISNPKGHLSYLVVSQMLVLSIFTSTTLYFFTENKYLKYVYFFIFIICLFALFINNSRSLQLVLFLTIMTFLLFFGRKIISFRTMTVVLFLIIIVMVFTYKNNSRFSNGINEIQTIIKSDEYKGSWGYRLYMYKTGIQIWKENLILGVGAGDSKEEYRKIAGEYTEGKLSEFKHMHNQHLEYLTRYGLVGYFLLFSSIVYLLYSIRNNKKYFYIGTLFFMSIFYNSFFNSILDKKPINIIVFIIFVLLSIVAKYENEKLKRTER